MALAEIQPRILIVPPQEITVAETPHEAPVLLHTLIKDWSDDQLASVVNAAGIAGYCVDFEKIDREGQPETAIKISGNGNSIEFFTSAARLLGADKAQNS